MPEATPARPRLEVALVAARRPDLLRATLASFASGLLSRFEIIGAHVNLDPVFGNDEDHAACLALLRAQFEQIEIFEPTKPGFGAAVQRVWAATRGDLVLHLEDDWLLEEPIDPARVLDLMTGDTRAVAFVSQETGWNGRDLYNRRRRKVRFLGLPVATRDFNVFGTSPRFLDGAFARACAGLMDPALDPEKQMRPPGNKALIAYMQPYACRLLPAHDGGPLITDIGRVWRERRGIEKVVENAVSTWRQTS